jgi:MFS family permease
MVRFRGLRLFCHIPTERRKRTPIVETVRDHWRIVLGFAGLSVFNAVGFYVSFVYLVSWLQSADHLTAARALEINSFSMAILLVVVVTSGLLTDRFGRKPLLFRRAAAILAFKPSIGVACAARAIGPDTDSGALWRHTACHFGGSGTSPGALHGRSSGLQHIPRGDRRADSAGCIVAGRPHRE